MKVSVDISKGIGQNGENLRLMNSPSIPCHVVYYGKENLAPKIEHVSQGPQMSTWSKSKGYNELDDVEVKRKQWNLPKKKKKNKYHEESLTNPCIYIGTNDVVLIQKILLCKRLKEELFKQELTYFKQVLSLLIHEKYTINGLNGLDFIICSPSSHIVAITACLEVGPWKTYLLESNKARRLEWYESLFRDRRLQ